MEMTPQQRERLRDGLADAVRAKLLAWDALAVIEDVLHADLDTDAIDRPLSDIAAGFGHPDTVEITDKSLDFFIESVNAPEEGVAP